MVGFSACQPIFYNLMKEKEKVISLQAIIWFQIIIPIW